MPTGLPFTWTRSTLSAAPTWSTIRRPAHSAGMSTERSYMPVGLAAGEAGGNSPHGICALVYCGRSSPLWVVQVPGTSVRVHSPEQPMGEGSSWKCQEPSRDSAPERRSTAFMASRPQEVTSGASQGRRAIR